MKDKSGYENIFEIEAWYFWGNMKVPLRDLDCRLGTKGAHGKPSDKTFADPCIVSNVSNLQNLLLKIG